MTDPHDCEFDVQDCEGHGIVALTLKTPSRAGVVDVLSKLVWQLSSGKTISCDLLYDAGIDDVVAYARKRKLPITFDYGTGVRRYFNVAFRNRGPVVVIAPDFDSLRFVVGSIGDELPVRIGCSAPQSRELLESLRDGMPAYVRCNLGFDMLAILDVRNARAEFTSPTTQPRALAAQLRNLVETGK